MMQGRVYAVASPESGIIPEQTTVPFECLALGAGGVACVNHAGAIACLEENGLLEGVKYVSGVSGGAIAALGVCLGYTADEIKQILSEMPMEEFMPTSESWWFTPQPLATVAEFIRIWRRFDSPHAKAGAEKFIAWLQKLIAVKMGNPHATNIDLDNRIEAETSEFGKTRFKKLYVGAVNLSLELPKLKIFGSDSKRPIELAQMVLMSACHPCLWGAVEWGGYLWGDGGLKSIMLMDMFDDNRFHPATAGRINRSVLGLKIVTQGEIEQAVKGRKKRVPIRKPSHLAMQVVVATSYATDSVKDEKMRNIIGLSDGGVNRLSLKLPPEKRAELIANANLTTREYLENQIGWSEKIRQSMQARLEIVRKKIACFEKEYDWLRCHYVYQLTQAMPEVYYGWRSEDALRILLCEEYLDALRAERDDIEGKLGLEFDHHARLDINNNKIYELFHAKMHGLRDLEAGNISYELQAVRLASMSTLKLEEDGESPFSFTLDFRRSLDRKLYLIAMVVYLAHRKSYDLEMVKKIVVEFIPDYQVVTTNFDAFVKELSLSPADVHTALFKLEALLHFFERKHYPTYKPVLDVDSIFKLPGGSFFAKPSRPMSVVAMSEIKSDDWMRSLRSQLEKLQNDIRRAGVECARMLGTLADYLQNYASHEVGQGGNIYFHGPQFELVQMLVCYDELIRQWQVESAEIECQLRIRCLHGVKLPDDIGQAYATFYAKMVELNSDAGLSYALRAVMLKSLPVAEFMDDFTFPFKFRLDLRDAHDRKLYLIAAMFYLEWQGYRDTHRFKEIFQMFLPEALSVPKSADDLINLLGESPAAAQISMFRIESLLHCFEKTLYPNSRPTLKLDDLFALPKFIANEKSTDGTFAGKEFKRVYGLSDARPTQDFVAPMSGYTDSHDHDEIDVEQDLVMRKWHHSQ